MKADKIKTLLLGMASINKLLADETSADPYFNAVVDRFAVDLKFAGQGLEWLYRADADTEEFEALTVETTEDMEAVELDTSEVSE